jgi:response regulator of citrate/malate metabolism
MVGHSMIRSLVVEDEQVAAEALAQCINRLPGFEVVDRVDTGAEALQRLATEDIDLVLLDVYLPDTSGLDVLRRLRGAGNTVDVIAITRARDLEVMQAAVSFGVVQYLVKPFTCNVVRQRLKRYEDYRARAGKDRMIFVQQDVDDLLKRLRGTERSEALDLPKGISRESLEAVIATLRECVSVGMSADEVAEVLRTSRVTARRYLEYLAESGLVSRCARYQRTGRPQLEYSWRSDSWHEKS